MSSTIASRVKSGIKKRVGYFILSFDVRKVSDKIKKDYKNLPAVLSTVVETPLKTRSVLSLFCNH
jgi:hypothetical protein